LLETF